MKLRVIKKKIKHNMLCRMWLRSHNETGNAWTSMVDVATENWDYGDFYADAACILTDMEYYEFDQAWKQIKNHGISNSRFIYAVNRYKF